MWTKNQMKKKWPPAMTLQEGKQPQTGHNNCEE